MESHRYKYSVVKMASCLDVSVRSYYDYRNGIYRKRSLQRAINEQIVNNSFELFDSIYGSARISLELSSTDTPKTTVMDLFDRKIIGWSFSSDMTDENTTIAALKMALNRRNAHPDGLLFHSDRGVQYISSKFVKLLKDNKISQSMSGKGNCWDNAVAESFFKTLKAEIIYGFSLVSAEKPRNKVFTWLEWWYDKNRRHSALNNLTIDEFWRNYNSENGIRTPNTKRKNINNKFPNLMCG